MHRQSCLMSLALSPSQEWSGSQAREWRRAGVGTLSVEEEDARRNRLNILVNCGGALARWRKLLLELKMNYRARQASGRRCGY